MVAQVARQAAPEATIVGVASRDTPDAMAEFVARHDLGHVDHVADVDGAIWQQLGIGGQPAWVFVDAETGSTRTVFGSFDEDGLVAELERLMR